MSYPKRGEVYWVKLDPTIGSEITKTRPALIISNDIGNQHSERVIVAPITSKGVDKIYPFEVKIKKGEGGLSETSKILLDQIRAIDKSRIGKMIGRINVETKKKVNEAIHISLDV